MKTLALPAPALGDLRAALLAERDNETCAIGFTRAVGDRLLAAGFELPPAGAYTERTPVSATLKPEYILDVANRARRGGLGCILAHSHPHDAGVPRFSQIDDTGEHRLKRFFDERASHAEHLALVVSPGGLRARRLGNRDEVRVQEVGHKLVTAFDPRPQPPVDDRYDRQVRAFGREGQQQIAQLTVGIVGAGGTGSITGQQLAYLGVTNFIVIDYDTVETTNLNRLVGASPSDIGKLKIDVAKRTIEHANPSANVTPIRGDVGDEQTARALLAADVIFLCTDSHGSRAVVSQLAYQYLIPTIDMGVSLSVRAGTLAFITGRVQLLAPGLPCLTCMDLLDSEQVRRDLMTPEARAADPYITGVHEPQPSVVSLNGTVASLAMTMFLGLVTSAPAEARLQLYDGIRGTVKDAIARRDEACVVCSPTGGLARGDNWPLPTRAS